MNKVIYVDNAATTPVKKEVVDAMLPYFTEFYGNASSVYSVGRGNKAVIEDARQEVAKAIGASSNEIYFTAGGSESDNWAIKGVALSQKEKKGKNHLITTNIEHHAVLHTMQYLEKQGFEVTYLNVDEKGFVSPEDVKNAIKENTALVSIMYANNEIGTIMPIKEIGAVCKEAKVLFHTDAVQAVGSVPIDVISENIDLLSMSAHKFNGPKGIGALYIKKGVVLHNLIHGGAQERKKRAGTENVSGIVGMAKAIELATKNLDEKIQKLTELRDFTISEILKIEESYLNGDEVKRLPNNVNICFAGVEGEGMLLLLDMFGICASSGSACTSGSLDPSHVLMAIGRTHEVAHGSLRISFSLDNTKEEAEFIIEKVKEIIARLRSMSPAWDK